MEITGVEKTLGKKKVAVKVTKAVVVTKAVGKGRVVTMSEVNSRTQSVVKDPAMADA